MEVLTFPHFVGIASYRTGVHTILYFLLLVDSQQHQHILTMLFCAHVPNSNKTQKGQFNLISSPISYLSAEFIYPLFHHYSIHTSFVIHIISTVNRENLWTELKIQFAYHGVYKLKVGWFISHPEEMAAKISFSLLS